MSHKPSQPEPNPDYEKELEQLIHSELQKLPGFKAPDLLVSNVLGKIQQREKNWWHQPWHCWPPKFQRLLIYSLSSLVIVSSVGASIAWPLATEALFNLAQYYTTSWFAPVIAFVETIGGTIPVLTRSFVQPWVLSTVAAALVAYIAFLGVGAALLKNAYQKYSTRQL